MALRVIGVYSSRRGTDNAPLPCASMMFAAVFDRLSSSFFPRPSSTYAPVPTDMAQEKGDDEFRVKRDDVHQESFELEDDVDGEAELRLVKKLDRRILPIACLMYLFACTSIISSLTFQ